MKTDRPHYRREFPFLADWRTGDRVVRVLMAVTGLSILAAALLGGPAYALDPVCDPSSPEYATPHDLAEPYVRPARDVRFCSSWSPDLVAVTDMRCQLDVDGVPYASAIGLAAGEEVRVSNPGASRGQMTATCEVDGVDDEGQPTTLVSDPVVLEYVPVPEVPAPVPLGG